MCWTHWLHFGSYGTMPCFTSSLRLESGLFPPHQIYTTRRSFKSLSKKTNAAKQLSCLCIVWNHCSHVQGRDLWAILKVLKFCVFQISRLFFFKCVFLSRVSRNEYNELSIQSRNNQRQYHVLGCNIDYGNWSLHPQRRVDSHSRKRRELLVSKTESSSTGVKIYRTGLDSKGWKLFNWWIRWNINSTLTLP